MVHSVPFKLNDKAFNILDYQNYRVLYWVFHLEPLLEMNRRLFFKKRNWVETCPFYTPVIRFWWMNRRLNKLSFNSCLSIVKQIGFRCTYGKCGVRCPTRGEYNKYNTQSLCQLKWVVLFRGCILRNVLNLNILVS